MPAFFTCLELVDPHWGLLAAGGLTALLRCYWSVQERAAAPANPETSPPAPGVSQPREETASVPSPRRPDLAPTLPHVLTRPRAHGLRLRAGSLTWPADVKRRSHASLSRGGAERRPPTAPTRHLGPARDSAEQTPLTLPPPRPCRGQEPAAPRRAPGRDRPVWTPGHGHLAGSHGLEPGSIHGARTIAATTRPGPAATAGEPVYPGVAPLATFDDRTTHVDARDGSRS